MSRFGAVVLQQLLRRWPNPMKRYEKRFGATVGTPAYEKEYTLDQFMKGVWFGTPLERGMPSLIGKRVLEVGCGPGGITCYLGALGARHAVGIDLGETFKQYGTQLATQITQGARGQIPVDYSRMDARQMAFRDETFDVVVADNLFEHLAEPEQGMREMFRVLKKGGVLLVPTFSSILSKYGLHLKHGIKMPWANLVFSEESIVEALVREAEVRPVLKELYPGLNENPKRVRDLRRFKDLNDMTHREFLAIANRVGFVVEQFKVYSTTVGRLMGKVIPLAGESKLADVLSTGAGAVLKRPS